MFLYIWYLGVGLKFLVSGRLIIREWCRHLPCFSAFVFACTMKSLFLIPLYQTPLYSNVVRVLSPWVTILQVAAGVEAFVLFAREVPMFRRFGLAMLLVFGAIAAGLVEWTAPHNQTELALATTAALERGFGFAIALVLSVGIFFYRLFKDGKPRLAYWHACCLAFLSVTNAVGWQMIQQKVETIYPTWIMVLGGAIPFAGWLLVMKESPTDWKLPLEVKFHHGRQSSDGAQSFRPWLSRTQL